MRKLSDKFVGDVKRRAAELARDNDHFRTTLEVNHRQVVFFGKEVSRSTAIGTILANVRTFNEFTDANDPYNEHDMGVFKIGEKKYLWKIDYLDPASKEDADPYSTNDFIRILSIITME